jgi:hypothetical protein
MTEPHGAPSAWTRGRTGFRQWRRTRPFWGGLLLILAGLELLLSANTDLGGLRVHVGYEGFLSYLLPLILALAGVFCWLTPKQRLFYAVIGTVTAVYSLIGLNLGGWFLGMILGIVGGALAFAWTPGKPVAAAGEDAPAEMDEPTTAEPDQFATDGPAATEGGRHSADSGGRLTALVILPLLLLASVSLAVTAAPRPAYAGTCSSIGEPAPVVPALPLDPFRALLNLVLNGSGGAGCVQNALADPAPTSSDATPSVTDSPTGDPAPSATPDPTTTATPDPSPSASAEPTPTPTASHTKTPEQPPTTPAPAPKIAAVGPNQPLVAAHAATMTASVLTLTGFVYDGVATVNTAEGPVQALKFSIDTANNVDFRLVLSPDSGSLATKSNPLIASGHVTFYATTFTGKLLGIDPPLTLKAATPPSEIPLPVPIPVPFYFTDVTIDLVFLDCDRLQVTSMSQLLG